MIACYPKFYDDELVYSFLARYFERTGYIDYVSTAKDLFEKSTAFELDSINYCCISDF